MTQLGKYVIFRYTFCQKEYEMTKDSPLIIMQTQLISQLVITRLSLILIFYKYDSTLSLWEIKYTTNLSIMQQ